VAEQCKQTQGLIARTGAPLYMTTFNHYVLILKAYQAIRHQ